MGIELWTVLLPDAKHSAERIMIPRFESPLIQVPENNL